MINFLNVVGVFAFLIAGFSIWYFVARYSFFFALLWPALLIVFFGWFQVLENIDPNWCEKQRADNGFTYAGTDFDEYKKRCMD